MKKFFKISLIVALIAVSITGCNKDYLTTTPSSAVDEGVLYKTTTDMQAALSGSYTSFFSFGLGGYSGHDNYGQKSFDLQNDFNNLNKVKE